MGKKKFSFNSLFFQMMCTVIFSVVVVAVVVVTIIMNLSEDIFIDTFQKSQERVFVQMEEDLANYHKDLVTILNAADQSWAFEQYLTNDDLNEKELAQIILTMKKGLSSSIPSNIDGVSVMLLGLDGESSFLNVADSIIMSHEDILSDEITRNALAQPDKVLYQYREQGFHGALRGEPVIMVTKVLKRAQSDEPYGIAYISIREKDFSSFYNYYISEANDIMILTEHNEIVSTADKTRLNTGLKEYDDLINEMIAQGTEVSMDGSGARTTTIIVKELPNYQFRLCAIIDNYEALGRMYDTSRIISICVLVIIICIGVVFLIVRQSTRPLAKLAEKMSAARQGELDQRVEIEGTNEVRELSETYNYMLDGLNNYVNRIVEVENEKREAEIHALQMQINPHYIYNTLSSIKWLIWQDDKDRAARMIDAFIALLRNTISDTAEFVTVDQEITNLKNYVYINNCRYGDKIKVSFYVAAGCDQYMIPKLILQPFVENAFFHAFTAGLEGQINVFIREQGEHICFEIIDNGKGMDQAQLDAIRGKVFERKEYFSGIGINNVDDRIKLIYGNTYGIDIESRLAEGTKVTILLPKRA